MSVPGLDFCRGQFPALFLSCGITNLFSGYSSAVMHRTIDMELFSKPSINCQASADAKDREKPYPSIAVPQANNPITKTSFLPPYSESASLPQSMPVQT